MARAAVLLPVLIVLLAAAGACLWPTQAAAAGVGAQLDRILTRSGLAGAGTGVDVWELDDARSVYSRHIDMRYIPASNLKLVTSAATLLFWGSEHRFKTELYVPVGKVFGGVVRGDVYLKGFGDPSLSTERYQEEVLHLDTASVDAFAKHLRADGVRSIRGRVLGDDSYFDRQRVCRTWTPSLQLECGRLSALTVDESLRNGNRIPDPTEFAARRLTQALRAAGIKVTGGPGKGKVPSSYVLQDRQYSAPLRVLLKHMDKNSDNFFAEVFVKGLGKQFLGSGSTAAGVQVLRDTLSDLGVPAGADTVVDGSGLSYEDRLTPAALVQVLRVLYRSLAFPVYYDSLAVAGVDGTLEDRMRKSAATGNAHAKTGSLNVAVCLTGYVKAADGRRLGFAILMNGGGLDYATAVKTQDAMVAAMARATLPGEHTLEVAWWNRTPFRRALDVLSSRGGDLEASAAQ